MTTYGLSSTGFTPKPASVIQAEMAEKARVYLTDDVTAFDPAHPDPMDQFHIPASPSAATTKPAGS